MARIRSIVERCCVDQARKAHNCQANAQHRIRSGDRRLKVRNGRTWDHYCIRCAQEIIRRDVDRLRTLAEELVEEVVQGSELSA